MNWVLQFLNHSVIIMQGLFPWYTIFLVFADFKDLLKAYISLPMIFLSTFGTTFFHGTIRH